MFTYVYTVTLFLGCTWWCDLICIWTVVYNGDKWSCLSYPSLDVLIYVGMMGWYWTNSWIPPYLLLEHWFIQNNQAIHILYIKEILNQIWTSKRNSTKAKELQKLWTKKKKRTSKATEYLSYYTSSPALWMQCIPLMFPWLISTTMIFHTNLS